MVTVVGSHHLLIIPVMLHIHRMYPVNLEEFELRLSPLLARCLNFDSLFFEFRNIFLNSVLQELFAKGIILKYCYGILQTNLLTNLY